MSCLAASPAFAQITGGPFELSAQGGIFAPDARDRLKTGPAYGGSAGLRLQSWFVLEAQALFVPSESEVDASTINLSFYGADMRFNLLPADGRIVPYFLTGIAYGTYASDALEEDLSRGAPSLGLGLLVNVFNQRTYLRFQARDVLFRGPDMQEFTNDFAVTVGLHYLLGGKPKDVDLDGVRDWLDNCPGTPIGATVDANGCPLDADADSVFDGIDKCPATPKGATVDAHGCPTDTDGDKVWDGLDRCADTPAGVSVDSTGCPNDDDRDGVINGVDECEGTAAGCRVDARGCATDADGDGVCDGLDLCAETPAGARVDTTGCPIEIMERQNELLDTGMIRVTDVRFVTGKAELSPESVPAIETVGQALAGFPDMKIEIRGHTDDKGTAKANQKLSEDRARAVRDHLLRRFPTLSAGRFTVKGLGESKPIAPNTTESGRSRNRRVEFVATSREELKREIERRKAPR